MTSLRKLIEEWENVSGPDFGTTTINTGILRKFINAAKGNFQPSWYYDDDGEGVSDWEEALEWVGALEIISIHGACEVWHKYACRFPTDEPCVDEKKIFDTEKEAENAVAAYEAKQAKEQAA